MSSIQGASILLYGAPKIGKTTLLTYFPRPTVIYATERGHKFVKRSDDLHIVDLFGNSGWSEFVSHVTKKLPKIAPKTVAIDTLDFLYNLAFNDLCAKTGVNHPADKGEYGKSMWHQIRMSLYAGIGQLLEYCAKQEATVFFICHDRTETIKTRSKDWQRHQYEMAFQLQDIIPANVDCIWCIDYEPTSTDEEQKGRRVLWLKGDEYVMAETRDPSLKPRKVFLTDSKGNPKDAFKAVEAAFNYKDRNGNEETK